ncbi:hypothetical protein GCM10012287_36660 [Streptomyces daqingensis]|uniref:Uncharacterized protein n=1 Tax=Streptomyces daqingensis TaxID=1472640 RepID=A0ABQ2MH25_9ACTN|nr:hypothetical protein GCM10012287_36660 [Streptomyces daqingensis]
MPLPGVGAARSVSGGSGAPLPSASIRSIGLRVRSVAVHEAQKSISFVMKLIHSSSAMGVPNAP